MAVNTLRQCLSIGRQAPARELAVQAPSWQQCHREPIERAGLCLEASAGTDKAQ